jgi:outer membrane protein assembly factor BamB
MALDEDTGKTLWQFKTSSSVNSTAITYTHKGQQYVTIASGLGTTSAYTWLKVPVVEDMERVMAASTLPALLLGGEVPDDPEAAFTGWRKALRLPNVMGLVAGRSLLYPADGDVAAAVDTVVSLL